MADKIAVNAATRHFALLDGRMRLLDRLSSVGWPYGR